MSRINVQKIFDSILPKFYQNLSLIFESFQQTKSEYENSKFLFENIINNNYFNNKQFHLLDHEKIYNIQDIDEEGRWE